MQYYITTPELAKGISAIKASQMGCGGNGDTTSFWWAIINHPTNGQSAISFTDDECVLAPAIYNENGVLVTLAETVKTLYKNPPESPTVTITTNDLKNYAFLDAAGWFPVIE